MSFGVSMTCFQSQELAYLYSKSNFCYDVFKKLSNFCSVSILSMGVLREPINAKPSQTCCYASDMSFGVSMPCFSVSRTCFFVLKSKFFLWRCIRTWRRETFQMWYLWPSLFTKECHEKFPFLKCASGNRALNFLRNFWDISESFLETASGYFFSFFPEIS